MPKAFSLQPLLELMQDRTDEATRRLGQLVAAEQSARSRLQLLGQYREEYVQRFRDAQSEGLTLQALQNFQAFLNKIDEAITQQQGLVDTSAQNTAHGQQDWQAQNTRLKAIDTLAVRHSNALRHQEGKQEQKQLDEFSSRRYQDGLQNPD